ncbi:hypothetical protein HNQ02_003732 [Flavobacterium sp. 7E]|uniref:DUF7738 domain-containing protein n=1 Tax=Flavobacterium sp. 7E TaxID=2735898 RepID=UPI00157017B3|nr:hypothetical protein [Flavobacterium sp. 7E]NRS90785.1 hypothetical protein [Flavobacterium sp. 7E]
MIKKIRIIIIVLFVTILNTHCQDMKPQKKINISEATMKIDSCGLYYKGKRLDLGTPVSDWEKVLGKPSRNTNLALVWDDLGIAIDDWQNEGERGKVAAVFVFFINLNSPEGKAGQLNFAREYEVITEDWKKNILENINYSIDENKARLKEILEENAPKNFIYPFTTYEGYVDLHGFPVGAGMAVAEINSYRKDSPYSGLFGYVDDDIDGVNDSGNTTETFGGDYRAPGEECKDNRLQYYELTYTATGALEYLKIGYESLSASKDRKQRDKDREKSQKTSK